MMTIPELMFSFHFNDNIIIRISIEVLLMAPCVWWLYQNSSQIAFAILFLWIDSTLDVNVGDIESY